MAKLPRRYELLADNVFRQIEELHLALDISHVVAAVLWRTQVCIGRGAVSPGRLRATEPVLEPVADTALVAEMATWDLYAHASYAPTVSMALQQLGIPPEDLLAANWSASADVPTAAYMLTVDHAHKTIVLTVRGSWSAEDALINGMAAPAPFLSGLAHHGMALAARALVDEVGGTLLAAADAFPTYRLVLTGHSMGAGVASLAALLLRAHTGVTAGRGVLHRTSVYGFAPAACMSLALARSCEGWIHSLVHQDDLTPRFHIASMLVVHQEMAGFVWGDELADLWRHWAAHAPPLRAALLRGAATTMAASWKAVAAVYWPLFVACVRVHKAVVGESSREALFRQLAKPIDMHRHPFSGMQYYLPGSLFHLQYAYKDLPSSWRTSDASAPPLQYDIGVSIHDAFQPLQCAAADTATHWVQSEEVLPVPDEAAAPGAEQAHTHLVHDSVAKALRATCDPGQHKAPIPPSAVQAWSGELSDIRLLRVLPAAGQGWNVTGQAVVDDAGLDAGSAAHHEYFGRVVWSGRMFLDHSTGAMYKHLLALQQRLAQGKTT